MLGWIGRMARRLVLGRGYTCGGCGRWRSRRWHGRAAVRCERVWTPPLAHLPGLVLSQTMLSCRPCAARRAAVNE